MTKVTEEHTGGSSSYYVTNMIKNPTSLPEPYMAECNDIIESLKMTFAEANIFKAIWRTAAQRQGKKKKGNNAVYDAEKCCFFSDRMLIQAKENAGFSVDHCWYINEGKFPNNLVQTEEIEVEFEDETLEKGHAIDYDWSFKAGIIQIKRWRYTN